MGVCLRATNVENKCTKFLPHLQEQEIRPWNGEDTSISRVGRWHSSFHGQVGDRMVVVCNLRLHRNICCPHVELELEGLS